ncbi:HAD family hydrolase [Psychromonas ossibalaenae]|uniref:HAD family hydrolase n=1 Tax=Psychromonas ossibalaenae TaxID=444922 RepID=UPI00035F21C2|nr:HAD-IA family hydrolase [Psychromonas ossibalaenae]
MLKHDIQLVLFDLGGVLVQLNGLPFETNWFKDPARLPNLHQWDHSEVVTDFQTGRASALEFAEFSIAEFSLDTSVDNFVDTFTKWPGPLFPGVFPLIEKLKKQTKIAIYSNTNSLHWSRLMQEMQLAELFEHCFASHLIGFAKPDPEGFIYVANELKLAPENILFLDDNPGNIAGAQKQGFIARQVQGFEEVKQNLIEFGFNVT